MLEMLPEINQAWVAEWSPNEGQLYTPLSCPSRSVTGAPAPRSFILSLSPLVALPFSKVAKESSLSSLPQIKACSQFLFKRVKHLGLSWQSSY